MRLELHFGTRFLEIFTYVTLLDNEGVKTKPAKMTLIRQGCTYAL